MGALGLATPGQEVARELSHKGRAASGLRVAVVMVCELVPWLYLEFPKGYQNQALLLSPVQGMPPTTKSSPGSPSPGLVLLLLGAFLFCLMGTPSASH